MSTRISHVAALVEDLEGTATLLGELLGWGPFGVYRIAPPRLSHRIYRGQQGTFAMFGAETHVGPIDFALNQRITGPSIYDEYVRRRGAGLHHIACMPVAGAVAPDLRQRFADAGVDVAMAGRIDDAIAFAYFDSEPTLGVSIETGSGHAISLEPDRTIDHAGDVPQAALTAITLVVDALDTVVRAYERLLGWGPWTTDADDPRGRCARAVVGPVVIELVEPAGHSAELCALRTQGPGIDRLTCRLEPGGRDRAARTLARHGLMVTAAGQDERAWRVDGPVRLRLEFG